MLKHFCILSLIMFVACDSDSNPTEPPLDNNVYATIISMEVSDIDISFLDQEGSVWDSFNNNLISALELSSEDSERIEILSVEEILGIRNTIDEIFIDIEIKLNFLEADSGPSIDELMTNVVALTVVGEYSVIAQEIIVIVDCADIPDGNAILDCHGICEGEGKLDECGVCDGAGETCTIKGIWEMENLSFYNTTDCSGSPFQSILSGLWYDDAECEENCLNEDDTCCYDCQSQDNEIQHIWLVFDNNDRFIWLEKHIEDEIGIQSVLSEGECIDQSYTYQATYLDVDVGTWIISGNNIQGTKDGGFDIEWSEWVWEFSESSSVNNGCYNELNTQECIEDPADCDEFGEYTLSNNASSLSIKFIEQPEEDCIDIPEECEGGDTECEELLDECSHNDDDEVCVIATFSRINSMPELEGCMDPEMDNFNPYATNDDGTCYVGDCN